MTKVPSVNYDAVLRALRRDGWEVVRQKGSHVRLAKNIEGKSLRLTVPAHKPIKRATLASIIKQARLTVEEFLALL